MSDVAFDCVIILNGEVSIADISLLGSFNAVKIAADGASNLLLENGIIPDYIVGDLDSFEWVDLALSSKLVRVYDQNKYDFEKCLDVAISNNFSDVLVVGMNGCQLDHTLNNWSIFVKYSLRLRLFCYTYEQIGTLITGDISFRASVGNVVSLIPIPLANLTSCGLEWDLDNTILEFGSLEGARNKVIKEEVFIRLHSGRYMLFQDVNGLSAISVFLADI